MEAVPEPFPSVNGPVGESATPNGIERRHGPVEFGVCIGKRRHGPVEFGVCIGKRRHAPVEFGVCIGRQTGLHESEGEIPR
eukprot:SAG11_NODE_11120_length_782_cov_2.142020_2_plen_81_part_00